MAELFDINQDKITLLDPGAGTGVLSAAFCEKLLSRKKPVSLVIDTFENDPEIIPFLKRVLQECRAGKVYISVFSDFLEFKRHIDNIAWETEVWIEANPAHMIRFNGPKFFTVYQ